MNAWRSYVAVFDIPSAHTVFSSAYRKRRKYKLVLALSARSISRNFDLNVTPGVRVCALSTISLPVGVVQPDLRKAPVATAGYKLIKLEDFAVLRRLCRRRRRFTLLRLLFGRCLRFIRKLAHVSVQAKPFLFFLKGLQERQRSVFEKHRFQDRIFTACQLCFRCPTIFR